MSPTTPNLRDLLGQASSAAAEENIDLDTFMRAAWQSYMDARPGLRQHLEELQLIAQIDEMRRAGKIGIG